MAGRSMRVAVLAACAAVVVAGCGGSAARTSAPSKPTTAPRATSTTTRKPAVATHSAVELRATPDVTPAELTRANHLLHSTIADLRAWNTPAKAVAAGYRTIGDGVTGDEHFVNW